MIKKNEEYIDVVSDIGSNGEGVIRRDNSVIFTPFVLDKEKVNYKILKVDKNIAYGKVLGVVEPSIDRVNPKCPVFTKCGGCQLQHASYKKQLEIKKENVKRCFNKVAGIDANVLDVEPCENQFGYRNKLQLPVGEDSNGTIIGFYAENSHRIIPINDCPINPSWTKTIISSFYQYVKEFNIKGYNQITKKGELREITVKEINDCLIITAVVFNKNIRGITRLIEILSTNLNKEFSLFINVNKKDTNVIYGEEFYLMHGDGEYISSMLGITYKTGVLSFMQVNREICEKLYSKVKELCLVNDNTTVIDAYSGAGLMTALVGKDAKKAIGIEIVSEAVDCANDLMKINGLSDKITNYCGKCEELLPDIIDKEKGNDITIILDPPRKGCDYKVIESVKNSGADRIVYVSCLPSSLARDVGLLTGKLIKEGNEIKRANNPISDYEITFIKPFDMFPQTKHVETLVCLQRVKNK